MNVLEEANELIYGERLESYGPAGLIFDRIADVWAGILGHPVSAQEVGLMMAGLKLVRATVRTDRDDLRDAAGYVGCVEQVRGALQDREDLEEALAKDLTDISEVIERLENLAPAKPGVPEVPCPCDAAAPAHGQLHLPSCSRIWGNPREHGVPDPGFEYLTAFGHSVRPLFSGEPVGREPEERGSPPEVPKPR